MNAHPTGLSKKDLLFLSFMLFSMFFGAGNLIFPPFLGMSAGQHVSFALIGFIFSAVGLPILGVVAVAKSGSFDELNRRVHPVFAWLFPLAIYLCMGPGLGIPRAGSLAFEMGAKPFLPTSLASHPLSLLVYTLVFFGIVFWLSQTPSKLVERFGKLLTPLLLVLILIVFIKSLLTPAGDWQAAQGSYVAHPVFQGFLDGYQTGDALAALAYGIVVANVLRSKGVENGKKLSNYTMLAGVGAGVLLAVIYLILGYLGASSASLGHADNGAQILTLVSHHLFGQSGTLLLGGVFTLACLCVSVGLTTSCSQFFAKVFPRVSYKMWVVLLCLVSLLIANLGLNAILKMTVPMFGAIYPIAIVLIALALAERFVKSSTTIYRLTVGVVAIFSLSDLLNTTLFNHAWNSGLGKLPFYAQGAGWVLPAVVAIVIGFLPRLFIQMKSTEKKTTSL